MVTYKEAYKEFVLDRMVYSEINIDNLLHNLNNIKLLSRGKKIIAVVKDDAYGHGAVEICRLLFENGIDFFGVANISEGIELRENGIKGDILIFGYTPINYLSHIIKYNLIQTIHSLEYAKEICNNLLSNSMIRAHIKIDTGMGRVGLFASDENIKIVNNINDIPCINVEGVYSHFSSSDSDLEYSMEQYNLFNVFCNKLTGLKLNIKYNHICNSGGIINLNINACNAVRPGIALYGYNFAVNSDYKFKPVMSLKARITHIKKVHKGSSIGYGRTYVTKEESIIATVNAGYGDGYSRYLSNKGKVIVNDSFAKIVGNICMDHFMIDITNIKDVKLLDEVILIGGSSSKTIDADDIANLGNTICYEVLCGIRKRVPRLYIQKKKVISSRCFRE